MLLAYKQIVFALINIFNTFVILDSSLSFHVATHYTFVRLHCQRWTEVGLRTIIELQCTQSNIQYFHLLSPKKLVIYYLKCWTLKRDIN